MGCSRWNYSSTKEDYQAFVEIYLQHRPSFKTIQYQFHDNCLSTIPCPMVRLSFVYCKFINVKLDEPGRPARRPACIAFRIILFRLFATNASNNEVKGFPCLMSRLQTIFFPGSPFTRICFLAEWSHSSIQDNHPSLKPQSLRTCSKQRQSTKLYAFLKFSFKKYLLPLVFLFWWITSSQSQLRPECSPPL